MKTLAPVVMHIAAALGIGLMIAPRLSAAEEKASNVVIGKDSIIIPGTQISKDDKEAMNKILRQYDKSLFKIEIYEKGQLKKTRGTLSDVVTDKQLASEIAENVKKKGFTQYAVQVTGQSEGGRGAHPTLVPTPVPPKPGASPTGGTGAHPTQIPTPAPLPVEPGASPTGGTGSHPTNTPTTPPPIRGLRAQKESEELVQRLKPILEKYSKN